jgi:hypothetical protein
MVDGENYYESQQMYKSTSARYCLYDIVIYFKVHITRLRSTVQVYVFGSNEQCISCSHAN